MVEAAKITLQDFEEAKAQILQLFNADEPLLAMDTLEKLCKLPELIKINSRES